MGMPAKNYNTFSPSSMLNDAQQDAAATHFSDSSTLQPLPFLLMKEVPGRRMLSVVCGGGGSHRAYRSYSSLMLQRAGCKRSHGQIAISRLFKPSLPRCPPFRCPRVGYMNANHVSEFSTTHDQEEHISKPAKKHSDENSDKLRDPFQRVASVSTILAKNTQSSMLDSKTWEHKGTPTLSEFADAMDQLYQEHVSLPPPSREWLHEYSRGNINSKVFSIDTDSEQELLTRRRDLCRGTSELVSHVKDSIEQGKIRALGSKDGYALSDVLGRAIMIYSQSPSASIIVANNEMGSSGICLYDACLDVFDILRSLNLDIHPSHYSCAIRSAAHESKWKEAAIIFLGQIEGDDTDSFSSTGGFTPIDPTLGWDKPVEIGLYVVARDLRDNTSHRGSAPSKQVFDTAMKMCMISPEGQEHYILAAGSALGRAGLWKDCVDFAVDTESISTYGPSIAAAAILACTESSRYAEAVRAYDFFMSGNRSAASEWQWAGGDTTAVKPLCRDLALHAMGKATKGGYSEVAMRMFSELIDDDTPISKDALLGVAHSLEHDGHWESSVQLLKSFIDSVYRPENSGGMWRVLPNALDVNKNDVVGKERKLSQSDQNDLLASILASTMRVCNRHNQPGLAMLQCSFVNSFYTPEKHMPSDLGIAQCEDIEMTQSILSQEILADNQQVFEAYMISLYGAGCGRIANSLSRGNQKGLPVSESWVQAFVSIRRVLAAMDEIRLEASNLSPDSRHLFERGLARAMDHCIDSYQPAAALHLFDYVSFIFTEKDISLSGRVKSFFGMATRNDDKKRQSRKIFSRNNATDLTKLRPSDPLLAAIIKAYNKLGEPERARDVRNLHLGDSTGMVLSANNTLEVLLDINLDEVPTFMDQMDKGTLCPSTYSAVARHYARNRMFPEVIELFERARAAGSTSEELALITMQAVTEIELTDGKIVVLRNIVKELGNLIGMKSDDWIKSRYWTIKRYLGYHQARLLMKWNNPATSRKEELMFAVNEMRQSARQNIDLKNAPLNCIARIAHVYDTNEQTDENLSHKQRRSSVGILLEACVEANRSGLMKNYKFTADVTHSLRYLKANKECIQLVRSIISKGNKCRHRLAMEEGMSSAIKIGDHESLGLITDVYRKSGFDARKFSV